MAKREAQENAFGPNQPVSGGQQWPANPQQPTVSPFDPTGTFAPRPIQAPTTATDPIAKQSEYEKK